MRPITRIPETPQIVELTLTMIEALEGHTWPRGSLAQDTGVRRKRYPWRVTIAPYAGQTLIQVERPAIRANHAELPSPYATIAWDRLGWRLAQGCDASVLRSWGGATRRWHGEYVISRACPPALAASRAAAIDVGRQPAGYRDPGWERFTDWFETRMKETIQ
jgi:hypothetical protein